jgi:hypothetical protein
MLLHLEPPLLDEYLLPPVAVTDSFEEDSITRNEVEHERQEPARHHCLVLRPKHDAKRKGPSFLSLPRELRDMIYGHLLVQNEAIYTNRVSRQLWGARGTAIPDNYIALSLTHRQIGHEVHEVFYRNNCFTFYLLDERLRPIPDRAVKLMRQIGFYRWSYGGRVLLNYNIGGEAATVQKEYAADETRKPGFLCELKLVEEGFLKEAWPCLRLLRSAENSELGMNMEVLGKAKAILKRQWRVV